MGVAGVIDLSVDIKGVATIKIYELTFDIPFEEYGIVVIQAAAAVMLSREMEC